MNIIEKQKLKAKMNDMISDVISTLEENRYEPSERSAGTAPDDSALDEASNLIIDFIKHCLSLNLKDTDLSFSVTLDDIINQINSSGQSSCCKEAKDITDDLEGLKKVDSFITDLGEIERRCDNTVYEHTETGRFICVVVYSGYSGHDELTTHSVEASEVAKKEIVSYEWS